MTCIEHVPQDVLSLIFSQFLDGFSVLQCKKVCVRWQHLINRLEMSPFFWKNIMLRDSTIDQAMEMSGNETISDGLSHTSEKNKCSWKLLYLKWHWTCSLSSIPAEQVTIKDLEDPQAFSEITCVFVTEFNNGELLLTGHRNGFCVLWNPNKAPKPILTVGYSVSHIDVINFTNCDGISHKHIVVASKKSTIKSFCLSDPNFEVKEILTSVYNLVCMKIFGQSMMILRVNSLITVLDFTLTVTEKCKVIYHQRSFPGHGVNGIYSVGTRWATLWNNKIILVEKDLKRVEYDMKTNQWKKFELPNWENSVTEQTEICVAPSVFLFRNGITFLVTTNKYLILSTDGEIFKYYVTLKHLGGHVSVVQIYGGILALGTNTGRIFVYTFKKDEDLLNIDLENHVFTCKISNYEIASIDIAFINFNIILLNAVSSKDSKLLYVRWMLETNGITE